MIDAVTTIRDWLVAGGFNVNYKLQADEWRDNNNKNDQFIVIYANSGTIEGSLQENPAVRLLIVGKVEGATRGALSVSETTLEIIEYARNNDNYDCLALIQPVTMPSGVGKTESRRPFQELNLTTIIK